MKFVSYMKILTISLIILTLTGCSIPTQIPDNTFDELKDNNNSLPVENLSTLMPLSKQEDIESPPEVETLGPLIDEVSDYDKTFIEENVDEQLSQGIISQPEQEQEQSLLDVGPHNFPEGVNPLTGLLVSDPTLLDLPPALVSISNFPSSARPQAGLNTSPFVFEMAIGEGMTRFLAMFYGDFPVKVNGQTEGQLSGAEMDKGEQDADTVTTYQSNGIGPIRSGRLPYEGVRSMYSGFLVMASAYSSVAQSLSQSTSIFGSDSDDIDSALIGVDRLYEIAHSRGKAQINLEGLKFSENPPTGGQTADIAWVFYSNLNQIQWRYDHSLGSYIRYDIKTDRSGEFKLATDRLNGEPLSKENIIIIFAEHDYLAPTLIDIQMINKPPSKALLFRDGEVHEIFWTTKFGDYEKQTGLLRPIRFVDSEGNPVPLKHGQTWVQIVSTASYYVESALSNAPFHPTVEETGTGLWLIRYKGRY